MNTVKPIINLAYEAPLGFPYIKALGTTEHSQSVNGGRVLGQEGGCGSAQENRKTIRNHPLYENCQTNN